MKVHYIYVWPLVAATALLEYVDTTVTTKLTPPDSRKVEQDVSPKRFLRVSESLYERDEEKTIPGAEMVKDWARQMLRAAWLRMKLFNALDSTASLTPAEFFEIFGIQHDERLLFDTRISALEEYILLYNREHSRQETLFSALASTVDEKVLLQSIALALRYDNHYARGKRVEDALISKWKSENVHPLDLLERLEIGHDLATLNSQTLKSLLTVKLYINQYNRVESNNKFLLIRWFTSNNDDYSLLNTLFRARGGDTTFITATVLINEWVESWVLDKKSMNYVLDVLKLLDEGSLFFISWKLEILEQYILLFNDKKTLEDDALDVLTVLQDHLGDGLLAILLFGQMRRESTPQQRYSELLNDLFQQWEDADMDPLSVKVMYFSHVHRNLANVVKHILSEYREFYGLETTLKMNEHQPRRS